MVGVSTSSCISRWKASCVSGHAKASSRRSRSWRNGRRDARSLARDEALAELARRYFTSHGPATWRDFAWWSGLRAGDAREAIQLARTHLTREGLDGQELWYGAVLETRRASAR